MKCSSCGTEFSSGKFCTSCGAPLVADEVAEAAAVALAEEVAQAVPVQAEPASGAMPVQAETASPADSAQAIPVQTIPVQNTSAQDASAQGSSTASAGVGPDQGTAAGAAGAYYVPPTYGAPAQAAQTPYGTSCEGILSQAWKDVSKDPRFVAKSALLGVISCVPILNFVTTGYASRWGRRAAFRTGDQLPQSVFEDDSFVTGFYVFVVMLVWGFVFGLASFIPVVGQLFVLAAMPFAFLACALVAMTGDLGAGFRVSDIWEKGKRNYGGLLLLSYVPALIAGAVICVLIAILAFIVGVDIYAGSEGVLSFFLVLAFGYVCTVFSSVAALVVYRGLGYWIGRMAPEWVSECISKGVHPQ